PMLYFQRYEACLMVPPLSASVASVAASGHPVTKARSCPHSLIPITRAVSNPALSFPLVGRPEHIMGIEDEFLGRPPIEVLIALRRLIERDDRDVNGLGDLDFAKEDRPHKVPVIFHHGTLAGCEVKRSRQAQADSDAQVARLRGLVDPARVFCYVKPGYPDATPCPRDLHE